MANNLPDSEQYLQKLLQPSASLDASETDYALDLLKSQVQACTKCDALATTRTTTVFGVGNTQAKLCFVGEAPGSDEDIQGEPFVGAAGQLLNRIITACQLTREEVFICNVLKCRPPENRDPLPVEESNCLPFLHAQLAILRPQVICVLGSVAAKMLLKTTEPIAKLREQIHRYRGIPVICTFHPAYLLRNPDKKRDVWADMQIVMQKLKLPAMAVH